MPLIRVTFLALSVPVLLAIACSDSPPPGDGSDGGVVAGTGGVSGGATGGTLGGTPTGTGGSAAPTGTGGQNTIPPVVIPDGGLNLDAGLPGLIDAGVVSVCPAAPSGKACGGPGTPIACVIDVNQPQDGCVCVLQRWFCPGGPGQPGADAGMPIGGMACPANPMGMTCPSVAAICTSGAGGCICLPGAAAGALAWRCQ